MFESVAVQEFEFQLPPRRVDSSIKTVTISETAQKAIARDLRCPICLESLKNAVAIECCLNRFCKECVAKYLQQIGYNGNVKKECPTCKQPTNHRKLKSDAKMCMFQELFNEASAAKSGIADAIADTAASFVRDQVAQRGGNIISSSDQRILAVRATQRDKIQKKSELQLKLDACTDFSIDVKSLSDGEGKLVFSLLRHPNESMMHVFDWRFVRGSENSTVADIKLLVLRETCAHLRVPHIPACVELSIISPSLGPAGAPQGCYRRLVFDISDNSLTLAQIAQWCKDRDLAVEFMYKLSGAAREQLVAARQTASASASMTY